MLTLAQLKLRENKTTASMAPIIMGGDQNKIIDLWRERIGEIDPHDFSKDWPVALGSYLETFITNWHEEQTGHELIRRQEFIQHPTLEYVSATIDCYRPFDDTVLDIKVCGAWNPITEIIAHYTPQVLVQMACIGAGRGALLVMHGAAEPHEYDVFSDEAYEKELWERLAAFQLCCETFTPPYPMPKVVPPEQYRTVDLDQIDKAAWPNWVHALRPLLWNWRDTKSAADANANATTEIKRLVPDDVGLLNDPETDINITRNRRGALSIKRNIL